MLLALANLDNGLFLERNHRWTMECGLAELFKEIDDLVQAAAENQVKNAAAAILVGTPPRPKGFIWLTRPE